MKVVQEEGSKNVSQPQPTDGHTPRGNFVMKSVQILKTRFILYEASTIQKSNKVHGRYQEIRGKT